MAESFGWVGKIVKIDLGTREVETVPTSNYVPQWIGGRALAAKLYWDEVPPDCGAFDPENSLIFATGPAAGTLGASSTRTAVATKSPEPVPECYMYSVPGGHWSAELKFAGFDAVVVTGKAAEPVYIWIHDGEVEILKAHRLWGLTTRQTDAEIRQVWGDTTRSMLIGPAGENLVKSAVILNDSAHATGIGGFGSVMGSKNLKAIAVRGTGGVKIARPKDLIDFYDENVRVDGKNGGPYPATSPAYMIFHANGILESAGLPEEQIGKNTTDIDTRFNEVDSYWVEYWLGHEEVMAGTIRQKSQGCFACSALCGYAQQASEPTGTESAPKDLNPPIAVGGKCHESQHQSEWEGRVWGGKRLGRPSILDTSSHLDMGTTIHAMGDEYNWFARLAKAGVLTKANTGLPVEDYPACNTPAMVGKDGWQYGLAYKRNDFFKRLAEGPERFLEGMAKESEAAKEIYELFISVPRYHLNMSKGYPETVFQMLYEVTQIREKWNDPYGSFSGGGKTISSLVPGAERREAQEAVRTKFAPLLGPESFEIGDETPTLEGKIPVVIFFQHMAVEQDSITMCGWAGFPKFYSLRSPDRTASGDQGAKMLAAITGIDRTMEESVNAMEAAFNLERAIHVREGHRREHDAYTDRFMATATFTTKAEFSNVLDEYYTARGWDVDTGIPTRSKLEELGLKDVADDLESKYGVTVPA